MRKVRDFDLIETATRAAESESGEMGRSGRKLGAEILSYHDTWRLFSLDERR